MPRTDPLKKIGKLVVYLALFTLAISIAGLTVQEIVQFLFRIPAAG